MPNPELREFLVDVGTVRTFAESKVNGQTQRASSDVTGIPCGIRAKTGDLVRKGYGVVPEAGFLVTFDPERVLVEGQELIATAGNYTGKTFRLRFIHRRSIIACKKAEAQLIP